MKATIHYGTCPLSNEFTESVYIEGDYIGEICNGLFHAEVGLSIGQLEAVTTLIKSLKEPTQ